MTENYSAFILIINLLSPISSKNLIRSSISNVRICYLSHILSHVISLYSSETLEFVKVTGISNEISLTIIQRCCTSLGIFILILLLLVFLFQREAQEREEAEQVRLKQMRKEQEEEKEVRRTAIHTPFLSFREG